MSMVARWAKYCMHPFSRSPCSRQHHANPTIVDSLGRNPLHVACASYRPGKTVTSIVEGANGRRTQAGYYATVQVLLEAWAEYLLDRSVTLVWPKASLRCFGNDGCP